MDRRAGDAGVDRALYVFAPRLPPQMIMRMYRAQRIDPQHGGQIAYIVDELSRRAGCRRRRRSTSSPA
jgi:hypothetical protein